MGIEIVHLLGGDKMEKDQTIKDEFADRLLSLMKDAQNVYEGVQELRKENILFKKILDIALPVVDEHDKEKSEQIMNILKEAIGL